MARSECSTCITASDDSLPDRIRRITPYIPGDCIIEAEKSECCFFEKRTRTFKGAVLYSDISGFSSFVSSVSRKGAPGIESIHTTLTSYYSGLIGSIEAYGGCVYQFAGDSVLCVFSQKENESDTETIARVFSAVDLCVIRLKPFSEIELFNSTFSLCFSAGIAFGVCHQILLGASDQWFTPVLTGEPVQQAVDAEKIAGRDGIVVHTSAQATELSNRQPFSHYSPNPEARTPQENQGLHKQMNNPRCYSRCSSLVKPVLRDRILSGYESFYAEHRNVTCLMVRFEGIDFTDISKAADELNSFFCFIQKESARFGGIFLQTDLSDKGDVFFILFGALRALENKERLAVDFALTIIQQRSLFSFIEKIQAGVATGPAYCGDIGAPFRKDYTTAGPVINLASRLMTLTDETGVFIDSATEAKIVYNFVKDRIENISVKGFPEPITVYRVKQKIKRYRGRVIAYRSLMIGRQAEMGIVLPHIKAAVSGQGQVLAISGEAGIGKSRLVDSILDDLRNLGAEPSIGPCYPYEQTTLYFPWRELMSLVFQVFDYYDDSVKSDTVISGLKQIYGNGYEDKLDMITELLGIARAHKTDTAEADPHLRQDALFSAVTTILKRSSEKNPLVLVFEDIQWIDDKSLHLLEYAAEQIEHSRICIILTQRCDTVPEKISSLPYFLSVPIKPLSDDEAQDLVRLRLNLEKPDAEAERSIFTASGNNPFYIESFIQNLADRGILAQKDTHRTLLSPIDITAAPKTISDLVLSRIDALSLNEQIIIKSASVIGRTFSYAALKLLIPEIITDEDLRTSLDKIESADLVSKTSDNPPSYIFKQTAVRDILYDTLIKQTKEELHQLLAFFFEKESKKSSGSNVERIAYHFIHARDIERGLHYTVLAGNKAKAHFANAEAIRFYTTALELIPGSEYPSMMKTSFMIKHNLADVYTTTGQYSKALPLYRECLGFYSSSLMKADILIGLGNTLQETGKPEEALLQMETALRLLSKNPSGGSVATIFRILKQYAWRFLADRISLLDYPYRKNTSTYEKQARILHILNKIYILSDKKKLFWSTLSLYNISKKLNDPVVRVIASGDFAMTLTGAGFTQQTKTLFDELSQYTVGNAHSILEAVAQSRQGYSYMFTGHPHDAIRMFLRSLETFRTIGERWEYLSAMGGLGECYFEISDFTKAESTYREMGDSSFRIQNPLHAGWMFSRVSFCRYLLGIIDRDLTKELLNLAIHISGKCNDRMNIFRSYGHLVTLAIHGKNAQEAAVCAFLIWKKRNYYNIKLPHVRSTLMYAGEAALFALSHGSFSWLTKQRLLHICRHVISELYALSEKFPHTKGYALLSEARYHHYRQHEEYTELYFSAALCVLSDSPDIWLTACAYRDAALALPFKRTEYLMKSKSLFADCKSAVDEQIVDEMLKDNS